MCLSIKNFFFFFFRGSNSTLRLRVISCCSGNVLVWVFFPVCFKPLFLFDSGCSHLCRPSSECVVYQCRWFAEQMLNTCHHQVSINASAAAVEFSSLMSFSVVFIHMKKPFMEVNLVFPLDESQNNFSRAVFTF